MYPNSLPFALALLATALFTSNLALYSFGRRRESSSVQTFAALLTAVTWFCGAAALELMAPTLDGKVLATQVKFMGLAALGPLWPAFALHYTRHEDLLSRRNWLLMALPGAAGTLFALTNPLHRLVWTGFALDPASPAKGAGKLESGVRLDMGAYPTGTETIGVRLGPRPNPPRNVTIN